MLNSVEQRSKELLYSIPCPVHFAGFQSDTLRLAKSGWDLSMRQTTMYSHGDASLQLAMRLGPKGECTYALSQQIRIGMSELHRAIGNGGYGLAEFMANMIFQIQHISPSFQFRIMPTISGRGFLSEWAPIDAMPQARENVDIADFKFFKQGRTDIQDIVVIPEMVPQLLDMVLQAQKPMIKEIKKREESRKNMEEYRQMNAKPLHTVQAQLITLAS